MFRTAKAIQIQPIIPNVINIRKFAQQILIGLELVFFVFVVNIARVAIISEASSVREDVTLCVSGVHDNIDTSPLHFKRLSRDTDSTSK